ncbi:MAG: hypothetical protein K2Q33_06735 [Gammaproteobacteria bacterium]|nr:hypothetical protein [Gammaproteobacteria bacterium]
MLKKVTFGLIALLGSASALAGHADDMALPAASGVNLMAPHQEGSWSFGLQANYFEPNNDLNYAYAAQTGTNLASVTTNETKTYAVGSDYSWGWGADITYHFPGEGRDVTLAFTQLNSSDHDSVDLDDSGWNSISGVGLFTSGKSRDIGTPGNFDAAEGKVSTDYDAVDLTFGQVITAGSRITLHPFAGLRYAMIDYDAKSIYTSFDTNGDVSQQFTGKLKSDFDGIGPRLGSDAAVNLGSGFSLRGTLGVSLLVGSMDVDTKSTNVQYSGTTITSQTDGVHDVDTNTRVVPEADAKLSAMYHADFNNGYGLGLEAGWQVTNYFDAIQNNTVSSTIDTSSEYTNFFMQGPYARIQLDVA